MSCGFGFALVVTDQKRIAEEKARAELKAAGMSQASLDGLSVLSQRFATGYPSVKDDKEATDKFVADFTADMNNFVNSMPEQDQLIYNSHSEKYGLS